MTKKQLHYAEAKRLKGFCAEALAKVNVPEGDAAIIADTMVEAELRGVDTHGVMRLAPFIKMLSEGNMNPRPKLSIVKETPVTAVMDADNGAGNLVCVRAAEIAIEKAKKVGVGVIGVRNSTHCNALAYYPMMALKHDMMGLMTTNCPPRIPPYGGVTRILATNPYAAAIPAGEELPVVLDFATTVAAAGKIRLKASLGEKIPLGWALDRYGQPTRDAQEALEHGFLAWMGDHKGYGLAVLATILAGVLTGSAFSLATFPKTSVAEYGTELIREGHFIMVLRVDSFMPVDQFKKRMDEMIREIRSSQPAQGFTRIYLPGEIEFEKKQERLNTGIPLTEFVWASLLSVKKELKLESNLE
ncbi:MAG: Ldh family oxidoreductase [Chloroflexota bacterium]